MEEANELLVTHTRTFALPSGGTVTVSVSGVDEAVAILQPELAIAMAERLLGVAAAIRNGDTNTNDSVHNVE